MSIYINMLRGINVGQNQVKMDALRKMYEALGLQNVVSYVQSGNIIFEGTAVSSETLEEAISAAMEKTFGFRVPMVILTREQLEKFIKDNPFLERTDIDPSFLHVTFLSATPAPYDSAAITEKKQGDEEIFFADQAIYLYCPHGYGRTKLNNNFLEAKLKVNATTRNWKTTNELLRLAEMSGKV